MKKICFLHGKTARAGYIVLILGIALCVAGATYASWTEYLGIRSRLFSGSFSTVFSPGGLYSVGVVDMGGRPAGGGFGDDDISCTLDKQGKTARLYMSGGLWLEELASPNRLLMLRYPLQVEEGSPIQEITPYRDDLQQPTREQLQFIADSAQLNINGYECPLPASRADTLHWDVYRAIEEENGKIFGVLLLQLRPESVNAEQDPQQLTMDAAELPESLTALLEPTEYGLAGPLPAEIKAVYSFSVPLYVEQGH